MVQQGGETFRRRQVVKGRKIVVSLSWERFEGHKIKWSIWSPKTNKWSRWLLLFLPHVYLSPSIIEQNSSLWLKSQGYCYKSKSHWMGLTSEQTSLESLCYILQLSIKLIGSLFISIELFNKQNDLFNNIRREKYKILKIWRHTQNPANHCFLSTYVHLLEFRLDRVF